MPAPRTCIALATATAAFLILSADVRDVALAQPKANCGAQALGVTRVVEIDAAGGPVFGSITKRQKEDRFLGPKEVVLTFDDGPLPGVTKPILDILDRHCTKATFFSVGKMAVAYPELVREILERGHTLGTHTWSHPLSLPRLKGEQARDQIESGFAAAVMAAGPNRVAPFFRFPGLSDSAALVLHLEGRNIATFTVDVVSNDSYIVDPGRLIERTLQQAEAENGGIMLFHDIKPQTARALPSILGALKSRRFKVVYLTAKTPVEADQRYMASLKSHLASRNPKALKALTAFTDAEPAPSIDRAGETSTATTPEAPARADLGDNRTAEAAPAGPAAMSAKIIVEQPAATSSGQRPIVTGQNASRPVDADGASATIAAESSSDLEIQPARRKGQQVKIINKTTDPIEFLGEDANRPAKPPAAAAPGAAAATPAAPTPQSAAMEAPAKPAASPAATTRSSSRASATDKSKMGTASRVPDAFTPPRQQAATPQPGPAAPSAAAPAAAQPVGGAAAPGAKQPQTSSFEVVAGSYKGATPAAETTGGPQAGTGPAGGSEIIAGRYGEPAAKAAPAASRVEQTWDRIRDNGN